MPDQTYDPFTPGKGRLAAIAERCGCTEGQLWSMTIGILLTTAVWANALPNVTWRILPADTTTSPAGAVATPPPVTVPMPAGLAPLPVPDVPALGPDLSLPPGLGPASGEGTAAPPPAPAPSDQPMPPPQYSSPLKIVAGGWASRYAGTPLATFGVPEGSVPVSARAATSENITFLKIEGDAAPLVLHIDPNGANRLLEVAVLRACVVTTDFTVGRGDVPLEQAPAIDCQRSVDGVLDSSAAAFSFDLTTIDLTGVTGLAIGPVASPTAPDFQVVLQLPQSATTPGPQATTSRSSS